MDRIEFPNSAEAEEPEIDWLIAEANEHTLRVELQRLKRRAKKRPIVLLGATAILVLLVLAKISKKVPIYQATVVMRATEGQLVEEETPFAVDGLANYLYTIALSRNRLKPIIEKHNLFPERETFGDLYAVDELRNSLDIEISSNAFSRARDEGDALRSVGIAVHFFDTDPELAFDVATDLSAALIEAEQTRREDSARKLKKIADTTVVAVEARMTALNAEMAAEMLIVKAYRNDLANQRKATTAKITLQRLREDIKQMDQVLTEMVGNQEELSLALAAENANQGMQFEIIDVRRPAYQPEKSPLIYAIVGLFLFVCLLPLVAISLSAMDSRLHHIDDLLRLNLPVLGHMPGFPGDSKGALIGRGRKTKDIA